MKKMLINPAEQKIVVLPDKKTDSVTKSGIILPSGVEQARPEVATIVAVGKGSEDIPMNYKVGQKVIYSQYAGIEIKVDLVYYGENTYKIMNQMDVMAIIQEQDEDIR